MKILPGLVVALLVALAQPAAAGPWRGFGGGLVQTQAQRPRPGQFQRQPQRDLRRDQRLPERDRRPDGRLTEEERRELHRDLDRANREIYRRKGP